MNRKGYQLYQMKSSPELSAYIYQSWADNREMNYSPSVADYDSVYDYELQNDDDIRTIRNKLERIRQNTGRFRAVSVSDVIVLYRAGQVYCNYVDPAGFTSFNDFFGDSNSTGNMPTPTTVDYTIQGKDGLWRVVDVIQGENGQFYLMENQEIKMAARIILDSNGGIVDDEITGDSEETVIEAIQRFLHPEIPKSPPAKHKRPPKELWQKYYDNGEYERHASHEAGSEENYNHIDGISNNRKRWIPPKKRRSVRKRLREKQALLHGKKADTRVLEKQ